MMNFANTDQRKRMVELYAAGFSLREVGHQTGFSMQCVHRHITNQAPHLLRPPAIGMNMEPNQRLKLLGLAP